MATPPPPPPPPLALTALHDQLLTLERQKASLTAQLLSLRATHPLSSAPPPTSTSTSTSTSTPAATTTTPTPTAQKTQDPLTDADLLAAVFASTTASAAASIARLHRIAGITTFTVRDPSPPHTTLLGIRIEVFCNRQFHPPHYLHITPTPPTPTDPKSPPYTIHRHTLPPFLALPTPLPPLPALARTLRRQLTLHARRSAAAATLRAAALAAGRVGDVTERWENRVAEVEWDEAVGVVVVRWGCGVCGWVCVGEEGGVGRVVVVGRAGRRYRDVERRVKGGVGGRLEGVAARLGWC